MAKKALNDVLIGKFEILATYAYAKARLEGLSESAAKQRGMVAAIMGAHARLGIRAESKDDFKATKEAAEKKKKTTITARSFDHQVKQKLGEFFGRVFLPAIKSLVESGLSYEDVKRIVKIPSTWGAKIKGTEFERRWREDRKH